jgi:uncharacterized membrane protein
MFSAVKSLQRAIISALTNLKPSHKQWLWFVGLWLGGLVSVLLLAKIIKFSLTFLKF